MPVPRDEQPSMAPGQASRFIDATRRREMAEEKARLLGRRRTPPSALEVAVAQWEREQQARAKEAQPGKGSIPRPAESCSFALQQVVLEAKATPAEEDLGWKSYQAPRKAKPRRRRLGGIAVGSFATRLIQMERGRGSGRGDLDPHRRALEEAARRWEAQRTARNPGR